MNLSRRLASAPLQASQIEIGRMEWGEWMPDATATVAPLLTCQNVVPTTTGGYKPFRKLSAQTNALDAACLGAMSAISKAGTQYIYAGTTTKLHEAVGATFADQSKGGGYSVNTTNWEFTTFGDHIIATNGIDAVQSMVIGAGASSAFADMITSTLTPKAKHVATVRDFVVLGHTTDATDGEQGARVWWSAFNDQTDFDPAAATQCDYQQLPDGGNVRRIVGGEAYGLIIQDSAVRRMQYVAPPLVFEIMPIDERRGTQHPNSVVRAGGITYWWSDDGFLACDGQRIEPIGVGKVDKTVKSLINPDKPDVFTACVGRGDKTVVWAMPVQGGSTTVAQRLFIFHTPTGRWSTVLADVERLVDYRQIGYTLDGLDALGTNIDTWALDNFDSPRWVGTRYTYGAFGTDHKLGEFSGDTLAATFVTGDRQLNGIGAAGIREVWPLMDAPTSGRAQVQYHNTLGSAVMSGTEKTIVAGVGLCDARGVGRFVRIRGFAGATANWTFWEGISLRGSREGDR